MGGHGRSIRWHKARCIGLIIDWFCLEWNGKRLTVLRRHSIGLLCMISSMKLLPMAESNSSIIQYQAGVALHCIGMASVLFDMVYLVCPGHLELKTACAQ